MIGVLGLGLEVGFRVYGLYGGHKGRLEAPIEDSRGEPLVKKDAGTDCVETYCRSLNKYHHMGLNSSRICGKRYVNRPFMLCSVFHLICHTWRIV